MRTRTRYLHVTIATTRHPTSGGRPHGDQVATAAARVVRGALADVGDQLTVALRERRMDGVRRVRVAHRENVGAGPALADGRAQVSCGHRNAHGLGPPP